MENNTLTYKHSNTSANAMRYLKAIGFPVGIFLLALFCISRFAAFGLNIVAPLTGAMWVFGVICALLLPSHRGSILTETHVTIGCYLLALTGVRELIALVSGVSSEMLMSTYNQAIPLTSGSTISGYLQTFLWITAIMTPLGFFGMQGKRVFTFRHKASKAKEIDRLRGIREKRPN